MELFSEIMNRLQYRCGDRPPNRFRQTLHRLAHDCRIYLFRLFMPQRAFTRYLARGQVCKRIALSLRVERDALINRPLAYDCREPLRDCTALSTFLERAHRRDLPLCFNQTNAILVLDHLQRCTRTTRGIHPFRLHRCAYLVTHRHQCRYYFRPTIIHSRAPPPLAKSHSQRNRSAPLP